MSSITRGRRGIRTLGAASAVLGAAAATLVVAAPSNAAVGTVTITPGPTGMVGTSCQYEVRATAPTGKTVRFRDQNDVQIGTSVSSNGVATIQWTPTDPGPGKFVKARQINPVDGPTRFSQTVTVGRGINTGSLCFVV
ncbi:hypothetical protein [Gordonia soli]|uniref:Ig-like domain-containing protein n=1 Tax=Gordonia soli NBRC 108243 TaxID=1223545 RepID=M0QHL6_9ACTN|nr:hypothetical protein [Gordonia soli]GAC66892.1 hypothetical protein GS4_05_01010 [Gordonia soli NBRC 108243]